MEGLVAIGRSLKEIDISSCTIAQEATDPKLLQFVTELLRLSSVHDVQLKCSGAGVSKWFNTHPRPNVLKVDSNVLGGLETIVICLCLEELSELDLNGCGNNFLSIASATTAAKKSVTNLTVLTLASK